MKGRVVLRSYIGTLKIGPILRVGLKTDTPVFSHIPPRRGGMLTLFLNSPSAVNQLGKGWTVELDRNLTLDDEQAILGYVTAAYAAITDGSNKLTERVRVGLKRLHMKQHYCNEGYIPGVNGVAQFRVLELRDSPPVRVDTRCPECGQSITEEDLGTECQRQI